MCHFTCIYLCLSISISIYIVFLVAMWTISLYYNFAGEDIEIEQMVVVGLRNRIINKILPY